MPNATSGPIITGQAQIGASTVNSAAIVDLEIVNADISASAGIVDTKLATISTPGKVSGAALTSLASIPSGAGLIPTANLPSLGDSKVMILPKEVEVFNATVTNAAVGSVNVPVISNANGSASTFYAAIRVPDGKTGIASIKLLYRRDFTGNMRFAVTVQRTDTDAAGGNSSDTDTREYASSGSDGVVDAVTLNAACYDGITSIDQDDLLGINITRAANHANDTYEGTLLLLGIIVEFS
jgi:hypothetical protein